MSAVNLSVGLDKVRAQLVAGLGILQDVAFHPHIVRTKKTALDKDERRHLNSSSKQENNGSQNERIASFIR